MTPHLVIPYSFFRMRSCKRREFGEPVQLNLLAYPNALSARAPTYFVITQVVIRFRGTGLGGRAGYVPRFRRDFPFATSGFTSLSLLASLFPHQV
jgi:hypothetical protein